jgi:uncharacterized coiled-coil protein SlyX
MPSILDVSRELLKRARRTPPGEPAGGALTVAGESSPEQRIAALEENERRQAELVTTMADQLAQLTTAVTALHLQMRRLLLALGVTALIAVVAIVLALR